MRLSCALGATLVASSSAFAQVALPNSQERRTIAAERMAPGESISLDGNLDEAVWQRAQVGTDFVQVDPDNGQPATEQTELRIAFETLQLPDPDEQRLLVWLPADDATSAALDQLNGRYPGGLHAVAQAAS